MMRPASTLISTSTARTSYDRLRETVLSGHTAFFQTALADALDKDFSAVRDASEDPSYAWLLDALRVLEVSDEKAFLVTAALYPSLFGDLQAIRLFLLRYCRDQAARKRPSASRRGSLPRPRRRYLPPCRKPVRRHQGCRLTAIRPRRPRSAPRPSPAPARSRPPRCRNRRRFSFQPCVERASSSSVWRMKKRSSGFAVS